MTFASASVHLEVGLVAVRSMIAPAAGRPTVRLRAPVAADPPRPAEVRTQPNVQSDEPGEPVRLRLLGGFDLRIGDQIVTLPLNVCRMIALLAVRDRPLTRTGLAYVMWMDTTRSRATANLRSTLWKLGPQRDQLVQCDGDRLWLVPHISVDLTRVVAQAKRLISPAADLAPDDMNVDELTDELLPDWDEEWLNDEREQLRQLRVHALEALCCRLGDEGRGAEAVCAGQAAVAAEPLRESAQRVLIGAHLAEGNLSEARRQFEIYRRLLWESLQLSPSQQMTRLLAGALRPAD
jgi:DNA-binding SARP family transcriptional activator